MPSLPGTKAQVGAAQVARCAMLCWGHGAKGYVRSERQSTWHQCDWDCVVWWILGALGGTSVLPGCQAQERRATLPDVSQPHQQQAQARAQQVQLLPDRYSSCVFDDWATQQQLSAFCFGFSKQRPCDKLSYMAESPTSCSTRQGGHFHTKASVFYPCAGSASLRPRRATMTPRP